MQFIIFSDKYLENTKKKYNYNVFDKKFNSNCLVWFVEFYGISIFVGYLTPNPFLSK